MQGAEGVSLKGHMKNLHNPLEEKICKLYKVCKLCNADRVHQGVERLTGGGEGVVTGCCRVSLDGHLKNPQEPPEEKSMQTLQSLPTLQ